jgi:hypothetical protein
MRKTDIDYSNTIIYKITCKDLLVTDVYVGHTINFVERKRAHKQSCSNEKTPNYKCKLYEVIRNNGGWENWHMEIVNFFNCNDHYEARQKEQEYFVSLNATLNSIEPFQKPKIKHIVIKNEFHCSKCNIKFKSEKLLELHNTTKKHKNLSDTPKQFECECCDYKCSKKSDFIKHESSSKHKSNASGNKCNIKFAIVDMKCNKCQKNYKSRVGLWRHKKMCTEQILHVDPYLLIENTVLDSSSNEIKILTNLVLEIIKSNTELQKQNIDLQKQMIDVSKTTNINHNNSHNKTINSHNKTFNLQFFLNEQCKDAMNIMDFVNTFQLQLSDLERIGEVGYVEGISNIVMDKLNQMDVYKRPIHCSDAKRETMHVKDNDAWTKDSPTNDKIRLALKHITKKNTDLIRHWINAHPGVLNSEHRLNDKYQELFIEAMGGRKNKNMKEGEDKIIKKICKMVLIDKNM